MNDVQYVSRYLEIMKYIMNIKDDKNKIIVGQSVRGDAQCWFNESLGVFNT